MLLAVICTVAHAQSRGGAARGGGAGIGSPGRGVFQRGGSPFIMSPRGFPYVTFAQRLAATISGNGLYPFRGGPPPFAQRLAATVSGNNLYPPRRLFGRGCEFGR